MLRSDMGHGDHWRCVFPDLQSGIADALEWVPRGSIVGRKNHPNLRVPGGASGAEVSVIAWPEASLYGAFIVVRNQSHTYLHTAFPAARSGSRQQIHVTSAHKISCGLEARISAQLGDTPLIFFDPLFCLYGERYRAGTQVDVDLAGLAYSLKVVPATSALKSEAGEPPIHDATFLMPAWKDGVDSIGRFGDEGAFGVAYIEQQSVDPLPDDYVFCACVKDVVETKLDEIPVWRVRAVVTRVNDARQNVELDIYVTRVGLLGRPPVRGDEVTGTLWLQGTLL